MSEQTPPTGEPTPTPTEGPSDGVDLGKPATPPPPADTAVGEAYAPPPEPVKKSRKGLLIAITAGLIVLAIVAALVVVLVINRGPDSHSISVPSSAGGMKRDTATEAKEKDALTATRKQFETLGKNVTYVKSGIYTQDNTARGPKGPLVFIGAKVKSSTTNASDFVSKLRTQAKSNGFTVTNIKPGDNGGKAFCAAMEKGAQKSALCGWATDDTLAYLVPITQGYDATQLAKLMIALRSDVEKIS